MAVKGLLRALGQEIRERRLAEEMAQDAFAHEAGLSRNFIGMIERGQRNPTVVSLEAIAGVFRMRVSELLAAAEKRLR